MATLVKSIKIVGIKPLLQHNPAGSMRRSDGDMKVGKNIPTPEAEAEAARYVMGELARLGVEDVRRQPFNGLRSIWLFLSLAFGMALVGHAAYWLIQTAMGGWIGLVICLMAFGMSGTMLWRKFTFRDAPLEEMLPPISSRALSSLRTDVNVTRSAGSLRSRRWSWG